MSTSKETVQSRVELGRFGKVYGIKGWLRVNSFTSPPDKIFTYTSLLAEVDGKWSALELEEFRQQGKGLVVHIKGYDDPELARSLTGKGIWIEADELPCLPEGEFYWHQLQGLKVVNQHGKVFGEIVDLMETGANDVLVIKPTADSIDKRQRLIPYLTGNAVDNNAVENKNKVVQRINLKDGVLQVNWEADYLE